MDDVDESELSEITILPDGRVYAFGITRSINELLHGLQTREGALRLHAASTADRLSQMTTTVSQQGEAR